MHVLFVLLLSKSLCNPSYLECDSLGCRHLSVFILSQKPFLKGRICTEMTTCIVQFSIHCKCLSTLSGFLPRKTISCKELSNKESHVGVMQYGIAGHTDLVFLVLLFVCVLQQSSHVTQTCLKSFNSKLSSCICLPRG